MEVTTPFWFWKEITYWVSTKHGPEVPHSRVFQLWLTLPANVGCYKGTVLGKMPWQKDMWFDLRISSHPVMCIFKSSIQNIFWVCLRTFFFWTMLVLKSYHRLKNLLAWNSEACGSGVQELVSLPFPLRRCWTGQNPEKSIRQTYFKWHKGSMSCISLKSALHEALMQ